MAIGPGRGNVMKSGDQPGTLFGAADCDPTGAGLSAKWTAKTSLALLFPKQGEF